MCLLALLVWSAIAAIELRRSLHDLGLLILALPRTQGTRHDLRAGRYIITGVALHQKCSAMCLDGGRRGRTGVLSLGSWWCYPGR